MKKEFIFRLVLALSIFFIVYQFGIRPIFKNELPRNVLNSENRPGGSLDGYDVVVLGEEPEGIAAAVSAARLGARVLLLAVGNDLGGIISRCLLTDLEIPYGTGRVVLNKGILSEMDKKLGSRFSVKKYLSVVNELVESEKNIDVKYHTEFSSPVISDFKIEALKVTVNGESSTFKGKIFIDATRNGDLLEACDVPYLTGSGDLNMPGSFMPVSLNFQMEGPDSSKINNLVQFQVKSIYEKLSEYDALDVDTRISDFRIIDTQDGKITIQGFQMANQNVIDRTSLENAYKDAVKEAESLAAFLSASFEQLKGWKFLKAADEFYIREARHFKGKYTLSINEILDNMYFDNTIAKGSFPVRIDKFAGKGVFIAGKPAQYSVPLGCAIPEKIDNLLMVGNKISYSSLAASSAGTMGTSITTGDAAGIVAVFSILNGIVPADLEKEKDREKVDELHTFLGKQGLYFPEIKVVNKNAENWSFPAVRQLLALGLVAGGMDNNFNFDKPAEQRDLAILLLNGVYRLNKDSYSLQLDARIRPYFIAEELTRDKASEILETLYDMPESSMNPYDRVCAQGKINDVLQLRLKDKKVLTMDDVYYLAAYNIKLFTNKDIND